MRISFEYLHIKLFCLNVKLTFLSVSVYILE